MKNLSVILERKGERKYNSVEINLTVVWESGSITKKVEVDEDLLTKILSQKSSNARQLIIDK